MSSDLRIDSAVSKFEIPKHHQLPLISYNTILNLKTLRTPISVNKNTSKTGLVSAIEQNVTKSMQCRRRRVEDKYVQGAARSAVGDKQGASNLYNYINAQLFLARYDCHFGAAEFWPIELFHSTLLFVLHTRCFGVLDRLYRVDWLRSEILLIEIFFPPTQTEIIFVCTSAICLDVFNLCG